MSERKNLVRDLGDAEAVASRPDHAMTIDVEDYFQVWAVSDVVSRDDWNEIEPRIDGSVRRILDFLAETNSTATFFTLGWIAERHPKLIRKIADDGHEVASHGYAHHKIFDQDRDQFKADISKAKAILEDITGAAVRGYRAPSFSIDASSWWAYEELAETGHTYSSSIHPIAHDHYHAADAPHCPFLPIGRDSIVEIPVATVSLFGKRRPCGGGGYFRLLPYAWSNYCWKHIEKSEFPAAVFYFHPWEVDPDQPVIKGLTWKSRFRHYVNLHAMEKKLRRLCRDFQWRRMDQAFRSAIFEHPDTLAVFNRNDIGASV